MSRLVEQLVERDGIVAMEVRGDRPPKRQRLRFRRVVHRRLEHLGLQIADRVPVDDHIEAELRAPVDCLVQQFEVTRRRAFAPRHRMHRQPHEIGAHVLHRHKELAVPPPLPRQLVGIGDRQPAKQHRLPRRIDKPVSQHRDSREHLGVPGGFGRAPPPGLPPMRHGGARRSGRLIRPAQSGGGGENHQTKGECFHGED